jgi:glycosyltransferase involved in cell wall biosynthesis
LRRRSERVVRVMKSTDSVVSELPCSLRVALVADGPPDSPTTNSGVALGLFSALRTDPRVSDVVAVNSLLGPIGRGLARIASFHPSREEWDRRYFQGTTRQWLRSRKRDWIIYFTFPRPDVIVHVRNVYYPSKLPYFAFVDTTYAIRQNEWPQGGFDSKFIRKRLKLESNYFRSARGVLTAGAYVAQHLSMAAPTVNTAAVGAGLNLEVRERATPGTSRRILFVGKEFERKGGRLLLSAFQRVRDAVEDAELHIVGPTIPVEGEGITCHGLVKDRDRLSELYASAGVFCLPAQFEPFGLVVLEAMAHGIPCVVTEVGVLPDLVADGHSGLVVPRGDSEALATALITLLKNDGLRSRMGNAAGERSRAFTWSGVAGKMVDAITSSGATRIPAAPGRRHWQPLARRPSGARVE